LSGKVAPKEGDERGGISNGREKRSNFACAQQRKKNKRPIRRLPLLIWEEIPDQFQNKVLQKKGPGQDHFLAKKKKPFGGKNGEGRGAQKNNNGGGGEQDKGGRGATNWEERPEPFSKKVGEIKV